MSFWDLMGGTTKKDLLVSNPTSNLSNVPFQNVKKITGGSNVSYIQHTPYENYSVINDYRTGQGTTGGTITLTPTTDLIQSTQKTTTPQLLGLGTSTTGTDASSGLGSNLSTSNLLIIGGIAIVGLVAFNMTKRGK